MSNVTAIFRQGRLGCKCGSHKSRWSWYSWLSWLSIDDVLNLWTTSACSSPHLRRRISESIFIAACSMHDYDEDRTEQRYIWRRTCARCIGVARWLSGRASDLRSKSRGFDCSPHRFFNSMQFNNSRLVAHGFLCHCSLCSVLHDGIIVLHFCFVCPVFCQSCAKYISFASQEYWTGCFDEIRGRQSLPQQIKWLHLGEIGRGTREQDTRENSNRCQSVSPRCQAGADA